MAQLCRSSLISTDSRPEFDELDHLPLLSRRNLLLASKKTTVSCVDVAIKKEEEDNEGLLSLPSACAVGGGTDQPLALKQSQDDEAHSVVTSEVSNGDILENSTVDDRSLQKARCGEPAKVKVENSGNHVFGSLGDCVNDFAGFDAPASKVNTNIPNDFADDDVDHILLKDRQRMLLKRRSLELGKGVAEGNSIGLSEYLIDPGSGRIKEETKSLDVESSVAGDDCKEIPAKNASGLGISSVNGSTKVNTAGSSFTSKKCLEIPSCSLVTEASKSRNNMDNSERTFSDFSSYGGQHAVPGSGSVHVLTMQTSLEVKVEPLENINLLHSEKNMLSNFSFNAKPVKSEMGTTNELYGDGVDHIRLQDRMKRLTSEKNSDLYSSRNPALQNSPVVSENAKPISVNCLRKRKKTATDSVETAMEEDAPGLLQVLVEQGVSVDEIKLYGEMEDDDALDETFNEDNFSELEAVMTKVGNNCEIMMSSCCCPDIFISNSSPSILWCLCKNMYGKKNSDQLVRKHLKIGGKKLFFQRNSMLKFAPIRCAKGSKPSYCLACLFSLVEQTRYLQFRKWPVEWGWCRDLQSFIFVFKRHNRLVLERPEYGYATYFFELVDSLPIDWQIKRLVTTMKLSSCGRVNLIENKSLLVGEDLTEGEAKVLIEFGWVPNTGLGTMLNYCDRVFHDRKNEKETSEWRSKIGKLLVDGYNGGIIVSTDIPGNIAENKSADSPQIKLEL